MARRSIYRHFELNILAGETVERSVHGRFLTLLTNTSGDDPKVSIAGDSEETLPKGISVELSDAEKSFTLIRFRNPGGSTMTITFSISEGRILDNRTVISGSLAVNATPDTMTTPAAAAATSTAAQIVTGASSTRRVTLQNQGPDAVWVGDANVAPDSNRGYKIPKDGGIQIDNSDDIWARTAAGETATVSIMVDAKTT
jgi:hypothetical protein